MDFDPLVEIPGLDPATVPDGGMVARLRYQQTKIDGAPLTILVGADVVQIVHEQQAWVRERWNLGPTGQTRYLFPRLAGNRRGTRPWETSYYDQVLRNLSRAAGLRDTVGQLILYSHSHRLRHTKATTLQIGRVASDATLDRFCDCAAAARFAPTRSAGALSLQPPDLR